MAALVTLNFSPSKSKVQDASAKLDLLRGDNGNGDIFQITTVVMVLRRIKIHWSYEGRESFDSINHWLVKQGIQRNNIESCFKSTCSSIRYDRSEMENQLQFESLVCLQKIDDRSKCDFCEVLQKSNRRVCATSWFTLEHSVLVGIWIYRRLKEKRKIWFSATKLDIFYFDGCSTYSYYLAPFAQK